MVTETSNPGAAGLFARNWWVFLLRGLLALFLGITLFRQPVLALGVLVLGFAVYVPMDLPLRVPNCFARINPARTRSDPDRSCLARLASQQADDDDPERTGAIINPRFRQIAPPNTVAK